MELLRLVTVGSVDDGKSTLIGRLLYDSRALFEDQLAAVHAASIRRGDGGLNLALITDGLRAEREQGITIDVAYRYFNTARRKFIIADCPGHVQYTRNMVTGASNASLAILLVDARKGLLEQTRRHCSVASLMRIPHLVVCVNKMDLVDYAEAAFEKVRAEFAEFSGQLEGCAVAFIPVSALTGDNVVSLTTHMPWYAGRPLLAHLEEVQLDGGRQPGAFRFPVQSVILPPAGTLPDYRGYAGAIVSGSLRQGDAVSALPSGLSSRVKTIEHSGKEVAAAACPLSVTLRLDDEIPVGRGDLLVRPDSPAQVGLDMEANLCWMGNAPLALDRRYVLKHTTAEVQAVVQEIVFKFDINTLQGSRADQKIALNDLARVRIRTSRPLCYDSYKTNRSTGSFILISADDCATVAAGMMV